MTRRFRVTATALVISSVMAMIGSVPRDAMAGIVALSQSTAESIVRVEGPVKIRPAPDYAPHPQRDVSTRYWTRVVILLLLILLILYLIYRTFTGWKPTIS